MSAFLFWCACSFEAPSCCVVPSSVCSLVHVHPFAVPVVSRPRSAAVVTWRARAASSLSVSHSPIRLASFAMNSKGTTRLSTRAGRGKFPSLKGDIPLPHCAQYPVMPVMNAAGIGSMPSPIIFLVKPGRSSRPILSARRPEATDTCPSSSGCASASTTSSACSPPSCSSSTSSTSSRSTPSETGKSSSSSSSSESSTRSRPPPSLMLAWLRALVCAPTRRRARRLARWPEVVRGPRAQAAILKRCVVARAALAASARL